MYAPVISKIINQDNVFIERALPVTGHITVKEGQQLFPYDHVGYCDYSQRSVQLPVNFRPRDFKSDGQFYSYNEDVGSSDGKKFNAPYNGNLYKSPDKTYLYSEEKKKYPLLSGLWGVVSKIIKDQSVLIQTKTKDLKFVVSTNTTFAGELIVFPNPGRLLESFYLDQFISGSAEGKIIYVGNHVSSTLIRDAIKYGIGAVIGGSADVATYNLAVKSGMSFGLFSGFGDILTPADIFTALNEVSNRFIFFQGERRIVRIPEPMDSSVTSIGAETLQLGPVAKVEKGTRVLVTQNPHFGKSATVDSVTESSIFVRFSVNEKSVEVQSPNFLVLK